MPLGIDLVDHGGQSCGLTRAGGASDQHQAAWLVAHFGDNRRKIELGERLDLERNQTEDSGGSSTLVEDVAAEAREALESEGKVQFQRLFEAMLLGIGHHTVGELLGFRRRHLWQVEWHQMAADADLWRRIRRNMKIASRHLQHSAQQIAKS
jgi:hypothetical protein